MHNRVAMADILRMLRKVICRHVSKAEASSSAEVARVPWLRRFPIVARIADAHPQILPSKTSLMTAGYITPSARAWRMACERLRINAMLS
jgi:hypothetical protein